MVDRVVTQFETLDGQDDGAAAGTAVPVTPSPGRYQRLGEIGRGGMGTVYSVRDTTLLRESAMKVLAPHLTDKMPSVERFVREARVTAQLDHPNIVPVHELGRTDGRELYYTMKKVEGHTFREWIDYVGVPARVPAILREMLQAFVKVCDALAFAHSRGVIHGDVKPDNVMTGPFGQIYVMDWGLARVIEIERQPAARLHGPTGTPGFMSPEQATGGPLDERTDVFGLGAMLYTILTGAVPFDGPDINARVQQSREARVSFPAPRPDILLPDNLRQIVLKAMAFAPAQRYATVLDLKRDVELSLEGLPFLEKSFPRGTKIVVEGESGDCAFIVLRGSCVAYKTMDGGRQVILRRLTAGAVFGEMAVLSGGTRTATVEAEEDVLVNIVTRQSLEENLGLSTPFGAFVVALADRFRDLDQRLADTEARLVKAQGSIPSKPEPPAE